MTEDFFKAIQRGDLKEVERILSINSSLIHEKENGASPVLVAVYNQKPEIADFLADKSGNLNIFEASALGKTNQVMLQLARDINLVNAFADDGFQPLGLACFFGHYETAEYLIKAGAPVNNPSNNAMMVTPVQSAAAAGHAKIVLLLLSHNANPNVREQNGNTPLHAASQNGDLKIIHSLLFNGADLTIQNHQGKLAVDLALEAGKKDAVVLLKEGITRRFRNTKPKL